MIMTKEDVLADFELALLSREIAQLARKEVLSGKAKFGIFGDGKEVAQIAMAKEFHERRLAFRLLSGSYFYDGYRHYSMPSSSFTRFMVIQMKRKTLEVQEEISTIIFPRPVLILMGPGTI